MPGPYDGDMTRLRLLVRLGCSLLLALMVAACGSAASSTLPSTGTSAVPSTGPKPTTAPTARPSLAGPSSSAGTTQTSWGTIWDTLPKGFPTPPGANPAEETATGPASADLAVEGSDAKAIATGVKLALAKAGYKTTGLQGPLEDGSYVLEMTGSTPGCKVKVTAAPTGGLTTVTILYGAACPHD